MFSCNALAIGVLAFTVGAAHAEGANRPESPNLGRPATPAEIAAWDISVAPDGKTLPTGKGSAKQGAEIFQRNCEACHGPAAAGGPIQIPLVGGIGTLATAKPLRTVTSYWPYATTLFDYIRRAMPYGAPESLTNDEVYALCAYILSLDGVVPRDAVLDARSLPKVKMPNRNGFIVAWPDKR